MRPADVLLSKSGFLALCPSIRNIRFHLEVALIVNLGDLRGISSALVSDALIHGFSRLREGGGAIESMVPLTPGATCAGLAYTIRVSSIQKREGNERERWFDAYENAPLGSVIVVQVIGDVGGAVLGDVVAHALRIRGVAGVIVEGSVRDTASIRASGFGVWCRSTTMMGMLPTSAFTETEISVVCDSVRVDPGDFVVADDDGVFVVLREQAEEALTVARGFMWSEEDTHSKLEAGEGLVDAYPAKG